VTRLKISRQIWNVEIWSLLQRFFQISILYELVQNNNWCEMVHILYYKFFVRKFKKKWNFKKLSDFAFNTRSDNRLAFSQFFFSNGSIPCVFQSEKRFRNIAKIRSATIWTSYLLVAQNVCSRKSKSQIAKSPPKNQNPSHSTNFNKTSKILN
jgi:hypothetical protein